MAAARTGLTVAVQATGSLATSNAFVLQGGPTAAPRAPPASASTS
eukprot:CAMPEP_0197878614 /NCGR_PEP_ID=MMETSP1439-20131203/6954_1 /TAXON_ID=66791 /ORGANISM="Gonyaulax spinifera, Strain CCMP409" /LENGTH=44 /DNA_ID= /DNA_START= /DNA_END= /DNA_ORIENTATION=